MREVPQGPGASNGSGEMTDDKWTGHYPDMEGRDLTGLVRSHLRKADSMALTALGRGHCQLDAGQSRRGSIAVAVEHRAFHLNVWHQGIQQGGGWCDEIAPVVEAAEAFFSDGATAESLGARFPWFRADVAAGIAARGPAAYVDHAWERLLQRVCEEEATGSAMKPLEPLIVKASKHPSLRQLLPFTSHATLCFSRTTGYPFTSDCPYASPVSEDEYLVAIRDEDGRESVIGKADAVGAVALLVKHLPQGIGPARHGTASK